MLPVGVATFVVGVAFIAVIGAVFAVRQRQFACEPGYTNPNQAASVEGVLAAARSAIGQNDAHYRALDTLGWQLAVAKAGYFGYVFKPEDVLLLKPFAEQWLSGDLPH